MRLQVLNAVLRVLGPFSSAISPRSVPFMPTKGSPTPRPSGPFLLDLPRIQQHCVRLNAIDPEFVLLLYPLSVLLDDDDDDDVLLLVPYIVYSGLHWLGTSRVEV